MWRHYLSSSWRNIKKSKLFSSINIIGLALGLAAAMIIFIWIENQYNYNTMFSSRNDIYLAENIHIFNGKPTPYKTSSPLLGSLLQEEIPEIKFTARSLPYPNTLISTDSKMLYKDGAYVDPTFLKIFKLDFIFGGIPSLEGNDIILTESVSKSLFGAENPINKLVKLDKNYICKVRGVIRDFPNNSTIDYGWLTSINVFSEEFKTASWNDNYLETYLKTTDNVDILKLNKKIENIIISREKKANARPFLYPLRDLHLYNTFIDGVATNEGNITYVRLFGVIGIIIILIACINYMNLSTALYQKRTTEISVRKTFGASRKDLISQFLIEAFLCSVFAVLIGSFILILSFPLFNRLINESIKFIFFTRIHIIGLISVIIFSTFIAGLYPAFYLSSLNPRIVQDKKGNSKLSAVNIRKILVILQFCISITLMIATIFIYRQIKFTKERNFGFNKNRVIYTTYSSTLNNSDYTINELKKSGFVKNVSYGFNSPLGPYDSGSKFEWQGKDQSKTPVISNTAISADYLKTFEIQFTDGRDFKTDGTDSNSVIINESMASLMGPQGKIGGTITTSSSTYNIIGIVKDFVFDDMNSIHQKPLIYKFNSGKYGKYFISISSNAELHHSIATIKAIFEKAYPSTLFQYRFVDEDFEKKFINEDSIGKFSSCFGILSTFISCLGLFGLSSFMIEFRKKEIGLRKALGASLLSITKLLTFDYLKLIIISSIIAAPLAIIIMIRWLNNYEYHIALSVLPILLIIFLSLAIAILTIAIITIRAAKGNIIESLRSNN